MTSFPLSRSMAVMAGSLLLVGAALPGVTNAATVKKAPHHRPVNGAWRDYSGQKGSMTVAQRGLVAKNLTVVPPAGCGNGRITILGTHKILKGGADTTTAAEWHIGATRNSTEHVTVKQGGTTAGAELYVDFIDKNTSAAASLTLDTAGFCSMSWDLKPPRKK